MTFLSWLFNVVEVKGHLWLTSKILTSIGFFVTLERLLLRNVCMTKAFTEEAFVLQSLQIKVSINRNDFTKTSFLPKSTKLFKGFLPYYILGNFV